jgi:hypothetical protein
LLAKLDHADLLPLGREGGTGGHANYPSSRAEGTFPRGLHWVQPNL